MSDQIESGFDDPSPDLPPTELPDGSGCFTGNILSKEEAMALPRHKRPLNYRISGDVYHAIFETVGHASMCWNPRPGDMVFDSTEAEKCAVNLCLTVAKDSDALNDQLDAVKANCSMLAAVVGQQKTQLVAAQSEAQKRHEEYAQALNKRVDVENVLLAVAAGKREPLTRDECHALADKLGQPVTATAGCEWCWDEAEYKWEGQCGAAWVFENDGPVENEVRFCPNCGRRVKVKEGEQ